jgi:hypothetical protein
MNQIATAANIIRDGAPGGATDVWKLTLYSDTGYVVDVVALSTRDRKASPLEEATAALQVRKYEIGGWVQSAGDVWNAEIQQTQP